MTISEFIAVLNDWGHQRIPFLFVVDFEMKKPVAVKWDDLGTDDLLFQIGEVTNTAPYGSAPALIPGEEIIRKYPIPSHIYYEKYDRVVRHLTYGDSYLTNLTIETDIQLTHSLKELYYLSKAKYKLLFGDEFLVFSPETFVQIRDRKIYSFPMKGTIDATIANAREKILADPKELAEHVTIVDLIRNDLSQVARSVSVTRFRYIDELRTDSKTLLQVSSEIAGYLPEDHTSRLGEILVAMLPAGSVSGAPKPKTLAVIREAEGAERGYYTGVFGYYNGAVLDSGVMIRFIERRGDRFVYRSGGGITTQSSGEAEYREAIDKVYVPFN